MWSDVSYTCCSYMQGAIEWHVWFASKHYQYKYSIVFIVDLWKHWISAYIIIFNSYTQMLHLFQSFRILVCMLCSDINMTRSIVIWIAIDVYIYIYMKGTMIALCFLFYMLRKCIVVCGWNTYYDLYTKMLHNMQLAYILKYLLVHGCTLSWNDDLFVDNTSIVLDSYTGCGIL